MQKIKKTRKQNKTKGQTDRQTDGRMNRTDYFRPLL